MPRLDLRLQVVARGPRHMGARPGVGPRRCVQPFGDRRLHQRVIRGVEAHQVDTMSKPVVRVELRLELVRQLAQFQILCRADTGAERLQRSIRPAGAFARDRFAQRAVSIVEVVVGEFGRLVDDFVRVREIARGQGAAA
jgi:hypothetical protein